MRHVPTAIAICRLYNVVLLNIGQNPATPASGIHLRRCCATETCDLTIKWEEKTTAFLIAEKENDSCSQI
jgi:hypothetical protein